MPKGGSGLECVAPDASIFTDGGARAYGMALRGDSDQMTLAYYLAVPAEHGPDGPCILLDGFTSEGACVTLGLQVHSGDAGRFLPGELRVVSTGDQPMSDYMIDIKRGFFEGL